MFYLVLEVVVIFGGDNLLFSRVLLHGTGEDFIRTGLLQFDSGLFLSHLLGESVLLVELVGEGW